MKTGDEFAGLDMIKQIGGPILAAAEAQKALAESTADFISKVGLNEEKIPQNEQLKYYKRKPAPGESIGSNETAIDPPIPILLPIPTAFSK